MTVAVIVDRAKNVLSQGMGAPILIFAMLTMMVLPLPPFALDVLFTFNIALSLIIMLVVVYSLRPLDFGVFPTVLLIATLLRLALNVASTRVVLIRGHEGTDAAGRVIESFGEFVIGGDYAVGFVVFAILVIINFVVVTKGAGRIAEVTARFTLDAMPGKQMAIDADLNAGIIGQDEARQRRELVAEESDFYGAMDGASKFVRGDAIAGILILAINIIGGLAVGTLKHGMTAGEAFQVYSLLTIGDGLVAQIPSLILSTATGIIVTRVSKAESMGDQVISQLMSSPQALGITAVVLAILGIIPGMPHMVFLGLSALMGYGAYRLLNKKPEIQEPDEQTLIEQAEVHKPKELSWDDLGELDIIGLEVGYRLIPLVDKDQGGELMSRIKGVRRKLSVELGFLIHAVHIRDNLDLAPTAYRITLMGVPEAESEIYPDKELAINPGQVFKEVEGIATKDPSFGLDAVWIEPSNRETAQSLGYTVVDASTVVATHMSQIMQKNAQKLFGYEEAQQVLDRLATHSSKLASDLVPDTLPLGTVTRVLQELLTEHVSIRDFRTIAEVLVNSGIQTKDINTLVAKVREALGRAIVQSIAGIDGGLDLITFDPSLEQILLRGLRESNGSQFIVEPGLAQRIQTAVQEAAKNQEIQGKPAILAVSAELRPWLSRMLRPVINDLTVLAYTELPEDRHLQIVASIGDGAEAAA